jgi:hypothetical protein
MDIWFFLLKHSCQIIHSRGKEWSYLSSKRKSESLFLLYFLIKKGLEMIFPRLRWFRYTLWERPFFAIPHCRAFFWINWLYYFFGICGFIDATLEYVIHWFGVYKPGGFRKWECVFGFWVIQRRTLYLSKWLGRAHMKTVHFNYPLLVSNFIVFYNKNEQFYYFSVN